MVQFAGIVTTKPRLKYMSIDKVHIVWCKSPFGVDFISVWDDHTLAQREADSLNKRDPEALYYVITEEVNKGVQ